MRTFRCVVFLLFLNFISYLPLFSQGGSTAVPFLEISPSAKTNGMGDAAVALQSDDPISAMANPAVLGMFSLPTYLTFGRNIVRPWLPVFHIDDLWYRTYAISGGFRFDSLRLSDLPLSIGFAYSNVTMNLGTYVRTTDEGPVEGEPFRAFETSDEATISIGFDYVVRLAAGITYRRVEDRLSPVGGGTFSADGDAKANLFDLGVLVEVPALRLIAGNSTDVSLRNGTLSPHFDFSTGIVASNFGQYAIDYGFGSADPLPRRARIGIAFDGGLRYEGRGAEWELVSGLWTIESADPLTSRSGTTWQYQSFPGDIDIAHELVLGKTNSKTSKARGWEIDCTELVSLFGGHFEESLPMGGRDYKTNGFSIQSQGIKKILTVLDFQTGEDGVLGFVVNHFNVRYTESNIKALDPASPLDGTKYSTLNVFFTY